MVSDSRSQGVPPSSTNLLNKGNIATAPASSCNNMTSYGAVTETNATTIATSKNNNNMNQNENGSNNNSDALPVTSDDLLVRKRMIENKNSDRVIKKIDDECRSIALKALIVYLILLVVSYGIGFKTGSIERLSGIESSAPMMAAVLLAISCFSIVSPVIFRVQVQKDGGKNISFFNFGNKAVGSATNATHDSTKDTNNTRSGIIFTAIVVQMIAFSADLMMATMPVPVLLDPVTKQRVFLVRWCEWAPLAFVMTFLTEICNVTDDNHNNNNNNNNKEDSVEDKSKNNQSDHEESSSSVALLQRKQKQKRTVTAITPSSKEEAYKLAWSQGLSTFCAWLFPLCPGFKTWFILLIVSFVLFFKIYSRLYYRNKTFKKSNGRMIAWLKNAATKQNNNYNKQYYYATNGGKKSSASSNAPSIGEQEMYNCKRLSLALLMVCSVLWTSLVVSYIVYSIGPLLLPDNVLLNTKGLNMMCESFIDVLYKSIYMVLLIDVHNSIFDPDARAERRLEELRQMMGVVWDNSSDVIGICVRSTSGTIRTVVSPTFLRAFSNNYDKNIERFPALAFEIDQSSFIHVRNNDKNTTNNNGDSHNNNNNSNNNNNNNNNNNSSRSGGTNIQSDNNSFVSILPSDVYGIEFTDIAGETSSSSSNGDKNGSVIHNEQINIDSDASREAITSMAELVARAWTLENKETETLLMHDLTKKEGYTRKQIRCEANVTRMEENALIIVVRDISERFRRFEAEKKVVSETTARLKDEAANRFTKHEVKNGLLASIGLCDILREAAATATATPTIIANDMMNGKNENDEIVSSMTSSAIALREESRAAFLFELDKTLHEVLETVMAEAMARDVIHEVYEPKLERVDFPKLLHNTMNTAASESYLKRFPLKCNPELLPNFALDPQLLKCIHRNAISNACKYGKRGGKVVTEVKWNPEGKYIQMKVVNLPGKRHEEILKLGSEKASELIFSPGIRLDVHKNNNSDGVNGNNNNKAISMHSAGDGAWIMSKCAKTLKGYCNLRFFSDQTVFTFRFPVVPFNETNLKVGLYNSKSLSEFELPKNIYGIAIDDSKIQRKLLNRYFGYAGIPKDRIQVYGQNAAEIRGFADVVVDFVDEHPDEYLLLVVDENLDFVEDENMDGSQSFNHLHRDCTVLGSQLVANIRSRLLPDQERHIIALIRSANDSANDIAIYNSRAHGYLPKSPIKGLVSVKEQLAPLWQSRYNDSATNDGEQDSSENHKDSIVDEDETAAFVKDLMADITCLDRLISNSFVPLSTTAANDVNAAAEPKQLLLEQWLSIWDKLHVIKGDLQTINVHEESDVEITWVINTITSMRGPTVPSKFDQKWEKINSTLISFLESLAKNDKNR